MKTLKSSGLILVHNFRLIYINVINIIKLASLQNPVNNLCNKIVTSYLIFFRDNIPSFISFSPFVES